MRQILLVLAGISLCAVAQAEVFDINVGSKSFRVALDGPLSRVFDVDRGQYDLGILSKRADNAGSNLLQGHLGLLLTGDAGATEANVSAGLGVRLVVADFDPNTGGAVALGGQFEFRLPQFNRVGFSGYAYGAPSATTISDVERYTEFGVAADYQVLREAAVYLGYRNVRYDFRDDAFDSRSLDTGLVGGLRLSF